MGSCWCSGRHRGGESNAGFGHGHLNMPAWSGMLCQLGVRSIPAREQSRALQRCQLTTPLQGSSSCAPSLEAYRVSVAGQKGHLWQHKGLLPWHGSCKQGGRQHLPADWAASKVMACWVFWNALFLPNAALVPGVFVASEGVKSIRSPLCSGFGRTVQWPLSGI